MRSLVGALIYRLVQIVLFPFAIIGYFLFVIRLVMYSRAIGEPMRFGIHNTPPVRARVAEFVEACGLRLVEQRNFGPERNGKRAPAGFAIAEVPQIPQMT